MDSYSEPTVEFVSTEDETLAKAREVAELFAGSPLGEVVARLIARVHKAEDKPLGMPTTAQVQEEAKRLFPDTEPLALALAMREVFEKGAAFRTNSKPAAPVSWFGYTSHGHPIPGVPQVGKPELVARCGGVSICLKCQEEAGPRVPWEHPMARPYFVGDEKWCRHPNCADTNWHGRDRVHLRGAACPEINAGGWLDGLLLAGIDVTDEPGE